VIVPFGVFSWIKKEAENRERENGRDPKVLPNGDPKFL
jgi:hypothetical protein